ncbi:tRNA (adenosine(37)-N6)-threonylcarbamoyltransferase complex dimerization subunit type 1 TsaB [Mucilaginibacter koreensis]
MSLILQIETATTACSVALARNGEVVAIREINERNRHAEVITLFINEVMQQAKVTYQDLDAVAVSSGPGSYTGLRIGVSTAKGICYAADKPLIAVDTLQAMAMGFIQSRQGLLNPEVLLCPMIDARRMEVYTALYTIKGEAVTPITAEIIDENSFNEVLQQQQVIFFGDGAAKCSEALGHNANAVIVTDFVNSAMGITQLAATRFASGQFEDVAYFEPYYLKDFIAGVKKA